MKPTLLLLPLLLAGCVSPENDRITVGRSLRLEAFQPVATVPQPESATEDVAAPSLAGVDRSNWQKTTVLVPLDGTAHKTTYSKRILVADKTRRQQRRYPTTQSALDLYNGSERQQQIEALYNDVSGLADYLLLIPRLFVARPWTTRWSPDIAYERYWHPERPQPEAADYLGQPFSQPQPQQITP